MAHVRPEAPSVELARSLATAMDLDSRESFKTRDRDFRHPFTRFGSPAAVRRSRAPAACYPAFSGLRGQRVAERTLLGTKTFALDPRWPRTVRGRCSNSTSATDSQRHVHPAESFEARGDAPLARFAARPSERESPANSSSHKAFDDAPRASVVELHASFTPPFRMGVTDDGRRPILRDLDRGSLGLRPRACGVVFRALGELTSSDAVTAKVTDTEVPPPTLDSPYPSLPSRREDRSAPGRLPSTNARSTLRLRTWPRTRTRHRSRGFATSARLPTLFRRLGRSFGGEEGLDRAATHALRTGRSWPRVARRLLPSNRSASTTGGPSIPVLGSRVRLAPPAVFPVGPRIFPRTSQLTPGSSETAESSFLGSEALL